MLENKRVADGNLPLDSVVHGVDVRLVDGHALFGQRRGVVDGNVVQLRMLTPVLVQDQQQLLGPAQRKNWNQAAAASVHNVVHQGGEPILAVVPVLVDVCPISTFLQSTGINGRKNPLRTLTVIKTSGLIVGISAAIRCRSSCREKSPVYSI